MQKPKTKEAGYKWWLLMTMVTVSAFAALYVRNKKASTSEIVQNKNGVFSELAVGEELLKLNRVSLQNRDQKLLKIENRGQNVYRTALEIKHLDASSRQFEIARDELISACRISGDARAMAELSLFLKYGIGGGSDKKAALVLLLNSIQKGYFPSYNILCDFTAAGREKEGLSSDEVNHLSIMLQAGDTAANYFEGRRLERSSPASSAEYIANLNIAMKGGSGLAAARLSELYSNHKFSPDAKEEEVLLWRLAAFLGYTLGDAEKQPAAGDSNELVNKRIAEILTDAASWWHPRALLAIARLSSNALSQDSRDLSLVESNAVLAFDLGEPEAAFYAAQAYCLSTNSEAANTWLERGAAANDWRCKLVLKMGTEGTQMQKEIFKRVSSMSFAEYVAPVLAAQAGKNTRAPIPLIMTPPRFTIPPNIPLPPDKIVARLTLTIGADGIPSSIEITQCVTPEIETTIRAAVKAWRFKSAIRDGVSVPSIVRIPIVSGNNEK